MSNSDFVKGACRHCGGHLEFPTEAAGQSVPCPHCGQPTELTAAVLPTETKGSRGVLGTIIVAVCVVAGAGGYFYMQKARPGGGTTALPAPVAQSNTTPVVAPTPTANLTTNDYAILPFKLEKTPGSSLVYVTGTIRNLSDRQRFGVKVAFSLFDTNEAPVGTATDYQSVLEPHGEWQFKAMVIESKAVAARFGSIGEAQ